MTTFVFMLYFRRVWGRASKCHFPHIQALVPPHHLRLRISALPAASDDAPTTSLSQTWPAPIFTFLPVHVRDLPERANTHHPAPCARISFGAHPLAPATQLTGIPRHGSPDGRRARVLQSRSHSSWCTSWLPIPTRVSKCFSAAAQLALYRALELSADDARAARPAAAHGPSFV
ncbi:hypothetical protein EDB85DRAFT_2006671, partial [Lactarius pseudohatsudake]